MKEAEIKEEYSLFRRNKSFVEKNINVMPRPVGAQPIKMENENINAQSNTEVLPNEEATEVKKGGFSSLLGKLDSVSESGLNKVLLNMPLVLFLFLLASLRIANNNMADNYARNITKTEKQVKELRWQYMTTTSELMKKSRQSEVARLMDKQQIKELRIPPYKIEVKKN